MYLETWKLLESVVICQTKFVGNLWYNGAQRIKIFRKLCRIQKSTTIVNDIYCMSEIQDGRRSLLWIYINVITFVWLEISKPDFICLDSYRYHSYTNSRWWLLVILNFNIQQIFTDNYSGFSNPTHFLEICIYHTALYNKI